jgi:ABC-type phosphate transport system substrate-binding protein
MRARLLALIALLAAGPAAAEEPGFQVIVHPSNAVQSLTKYELSSLFLKKATSWPGGAAVQPVEPPEGADARDRFAAQVLGKSPGAVKSYWNKLIFAGREVPPVEKRSDKEVIAFVRATPGAVGYVSVGAPLAGVKPVKLLKE